VRRVARLVVCNPRKNALLKSGNKSDAIDARKLAELLRADMLSPVYHGEKSAMEVQHLARSYALLTEDTTRVMARLKAVFRGQAIACAGKKLYGKQASRRVSCAVRNGRAAAARRVSLSGVGGLQQLRRQAKRDMIVECRKYPETKLLCSVPFLGPVRAAVLIGRVQTPHRFRTKRQFWAYCGLALEMRDSGEYRMVDGQVERRKEAGADSRLELEPQP
jgi:transposase